MVPPSGGTNRQLLGDTADSGEARFCDSVRLSLHPDKTRLIEFGRHAAVRRERRGLGKAETFNFLGFTFICGESLKGNFLLHRKSRGDRMRAKLQEIQEELRQRRHQPIPLQGEWLRSVVSGYFNYHAVPTNGRALTVFPTMFAACGCARSSDAANGTDRHGRG